MSDATMEDTYVDDPMDWTPAIPQHLQRKFDELKLCSTTCVFVKISGGKEDECPICFEEYSDGDILIKEIGCQHIFCVECFFKGTKSTKQCPICRRLIRNARGRIIDCAYEEIEKIGDEYLLTAETYLVDTVEQLELDFDTDSGTFPLRARAEAAKNWNGCCKSYDEILSRFEEETSLDAVDDTILLQIQQILISVSAEFEADILPDLDAPVSKKLEILSQQLAQVHSRLSKALNLCAGLVPDDDGLFCFIK